MTKTLITAFCAIGFAGATLADMEREAQVYDLNVTVKTTAAKSGKPKKNPFVLGSDSIVYRAQTSRKWKGLVWGCDCESLAGKWMVIDETQQSVAGCVIWDTKSQAIVFLDDLNWRLLNAIDAKGDKCEGSFTIGEMSSDSGAFLTFAGFGTLSIRYTNTPCEDPELNCTSYLKTMSGNVAGWMPAPAKTTAGKPGVCIFCGEGEDPEEPTSDLSEAWDFCPCEEYADVEYTAVSGTWTLKYNAGLSKKLKDKPRITNVYKFPSSVAGQVEAKIAETL